MKMMANREPIRRQVLEDLRHLHPPSRSGDRGSCDLLRKMLSYFRLASRQCLVPRSRVPRICVRPCSDPPALPDIGHQFPALLVDVLEPKPEIDGVAIGCREVGGRRMGQLVVTQHYIARFDHQL